MENKKKPNCIILYHYYYPDDVVSSRHFTDLAEGLCLRNWNVTVFTSNYYCRKSGTISSLKEIHNRVIIRRFRRFAISQSSNLGRLLNSVVLSIQWFIALLFSKTDIVIFGTDPQFGYFIIPFVAFFRKKLHFAIWGFDLYPEAIFAHGINIPVSLKKILIWSAGKSYNCCHLLVDIGFCMRNRFNKYQSPVRCETITPWALHEPEALALPDMQTRHELFGNSKLSILYSGTIGIAHQFDEFIALARELRSRKASVSFCFAGHGNRYHELKEKIIPEDINITFAGFTEEEQLPLRLNAADIHMVSLRSGWEGIVVPSKFFGSLASGRPILYCGTHNSCVAQWIKSERLGFIVDNDTIIQTADQLEELSLNQEQLHSMQKHVLSFYKNNFTEKIQCNRWNNILRDILKY